MTRKKNVETHTCLENKKKKKREKNLRNKHLPKKGDSKTFEMLKTESELNHRVRKKGVFKYPLL